MSYQRKFVTLVIRSACRYKKEVGPSSVFDNFTVTRMENVLNNIERKIVEPVIEPKKEISHER